MEGGRQSRCANDEEEEECVAHAPFMCVASRNQVVRPAEKFTKEHRTHTQSR
jgi:hypothetical protein